MWVFQYFLTYTSLLKWYNFPSIVSMCTIIWNVKGYMVTNKCNGRSYVIFLLILPLHHLKYKQITDHKNDLLCSLYVLTVRHISRSLVITKWQYQ